MIDRIVEPALWPAFSTMVELPRDRKWVTLTRCPSSHLWLVNDKGLEVPLWLGEPVPLLVGRRYRVRAAAHSNEAVVVPSASGTAVTYRERTIELVCSDTPVVGGEQRLQLRVNGNTATIGSTWLVRVATRRLVAFSARLRVSGDTVTAGLFGIDEEGVLSDASDYVPGISPNIANNTGQALGAALDHTPVYNAASYLLENLGDHMGILISSTYAAGTSLRVSCVGVPRRT